MTDPRVLIVTALRNEGPYLVDWLAHLLGAGADHFLIYSNDCDDGSAAMLDALQHAGVVTHVPHSPATDVSVQWQAFRAAWKHDARKRADWVMVCDVDEYINIHTGQHRFADLIAAVGDADAVALPWRLFGATTPEQTDRPVTETCTRSMTADCPFPVMATYFKSLIRTDGPFNQLGIHRPSQKSVDKAGLPRWVDGSGTPLPDHFARNPKRLSLVGYDPGRALAEMHHYSLRTPQAFMVKRDRGLPHHRDRAVDLRYWVERNFRTVENTSIAAMAPATRAARARLMAIDGLADLHAQAQAWHKARFQELLKDEANYHLFCDIMLAGDTRELPASQAHMLYRAYQRFVR